MTGREHEGGFQGGNILFYVLGIGYKGVKFVKIWANMLMYAFLYEYSTLNRKTTFSSTTIIVTKSSKFQIIQEVNKK